MKKASLSIITVSYKNLSGLKKTFESIQCLLTQQTPSVQWVVVDAASDSETLEYLKKIESITSNFSYIFERDNGIYDAMNKGVKKAVGEYALFLNAGDTITNESNLNEAIKKIDLGYDAIFLGAYYDYGKYRYLRSPKSLCYARYGMPANHQAIIYKKAFLEAHPYPLKYGLSEDYWLSATLLKCNSNCAAYEIPISRFEVGGVSTVRFWEVCASMASIQREVLSLSQIKICAYYIRRILIMTANYLIHKTMRNA